ncbi:AAA family ATPase [uncultured Desulfosarcina sp.]|uniref:AAA family ATPase n=1 Tax=uncultured Desulfosarcina sp. TaxID=218289 RepID=UPI0029C87136|nr:AAA family ATPase [uncultured Desulfosarcina sp.]
MYLDHYRLHLKPFQISTDPRFLWLGEKHKEALAVLKYGILDNKGFLLLTGDVGTGKTTLLHTLVDSLGDDVLVAMITDPGLAKMDFFNFVADSFGMDKNFRSKGDFLISLKEYLLAVHGQNKQALLIIDECQHLSQKLLEEVRLLSNIEKQNTKLINIFFVGQSEFNEIILRPRNRAIRQRITINYNISALSETETEKYIRYRLDVAGTKEDIFTSRAIKEVYKFSNGYPRLINIICDQALLTGFVKEKKKIDHKIVAECAQELKIPHGLSTRKSMATPEAADKKTIEPERADGMGKNALESANKSFNQPLVIALIVVVAIWLGLVAFFFLGHWQAPVNKMSHGTGSKSQLSSSQEMETARPSARSGTSYSSLEGQGAIEGSNVDSRVASGVVANSEKQYSTDAVKPTESEKRATSSFAAQKPSPVAKPSDNGTSDNKITLDQIHENFGIYPEISFAFDANTFGTEAYDMLDIIAHYCLENPDATLVLRGYTDATGVRTYNMKLSEFRANMVKTYLVGKGVNAEVITTLGIGPGTDGPGNTTIALEKNRRKVIVEIIPPGE